MCLPPWATAFLHRPVLPLPSRLPLSLSLPLSPFPLRLCCGRRRLRFVLLRPVLFRVVVLRGLPVVALVRLVSCFRFVSFRLVGRLSFIGSFQGPPSYNQVRFWCGTAWAAWRR